MDTRSWKPVLAEAFTWIGTPFHHKGDKKGVGADCGGFVHKCFQTIINLPPFPQEHAADWALHSDRELYLEYIEPFTNEIPLPTIGGLAIYQYGLCYSHATIVTEDMLRIHCWGRTEFGGVQVSVPRFFCWPSGKLRKVKYFDIKPELEKWN